jgi:hypothetical protein
MLRYLQPADEVFRDVVQEALSWMIEDLRENSQDPEAYHDLAPRAAGFLDPSAAIETLEQLRTSSEAPDLYQLKAPHRLLLTDAITRYCDLFNEEPFGGYGSQVHEKYGLRHLDGERLITSFIGTVGGGPSRSENRGHRISAVEILHGKRIRPQDLVLRIAAGAEQESVMPATVSPWYRAGAESYPVVTAIA